MNLDQTYRYGPMSVSFEASTGNWIGWSYKEEALLHDPAGSSFSLNWLDGITGLTRLQSMERFDIRGGLRIVQSYEMDVNLSHRSRTYYLTQTFDLLEKPNRIERRITVIGTKGDPIASAHMDRLHSVTLSIGGMAAGQPEKSTMSIPMARLKPGMSWHDMLNRPERFNGHNECVHGHMDVFLTAPDGISGTVAVERTSPDLIVSATPLPRECPVKTHVFSKASTVVIEHEFICESWITSHTPAFEAGTQVLFAQESDWMHGLLHVGQYLHTHGGFAPPTDRPDWAKSAVVYEIDLEFHGGLRSVIAKLDDIQNDGFNTLYLMPWHQGGYGTIHYEQMNPAYGTFDDLKALTAEAHRRGMKVLFDLLVNIADKRSPYIAEHPEWFYRNEDGSLKPHPAWGGACFDPSSPSLQQYIVDYCVRCCREWGADGFRVDAVAYRGGEWSKTSPLQPHQHSHAVFPLVARIREEIRAYNPEAILMAECFGPLQVPISDLVCYQWISWLDWMLGSITDGTLTGAELQRLLGEQFLSHPRDTWFTTYTHTHDTVAFENRDIQGDAVDTLFATLTFLGMGVMVFGGGWEMRERPSREEKETYTALFAMKQRLGGVAGCDIRFPSEFPAQSALFVADRPSSEGTVRLISNFNDSPAALPDACGDLLFSKSGNSHSEFIAPWDTIIVRMKQL